MEIKCCFLFAFYLVKGYNIEKKYNIAIIVLLSTNQFADILCVSDKIENYLNKKDY